MMSTGVGVKPSDPNGGVKGEALERPEGGPQGSEEFGAVWKQMQAKYGKPPEKQKVIKKQLDKDDFMRIMITQMKNQDPTQPFKAEQFASELAQYSTVEQLHNLNSAMEKMSKQNQPMERMAMTGMIGKTITVDRERFFHSENTKEALALDLPKDAAEVHVSIVGENGEEVYSKDLGPQKKGQLIVDWDGEKSTGTPTKSGTYLLRVFPKDEKGVIIPTNPKMQTRVVGVSFDDKEPVFLVGDLSKPEKILMRNVVKVDGDTSNLIPGAQSLAAQDAQGGGSLENIANQMAAQLAAKKSPSAPVSNAQPAQPQRTLSPFSPLNHPLQNAEVQRPVDSPNVPKNSPRLTPEVQQALAQYEAQRREAMSRSADSSPNSPTNLAPANSRSNEAVGFPNGLSSQREENELKGGKKQ